MNFSGLISRNLVGTVLALGLTGVFLPAATVVSGFDVANGAYTNGATVVGVQDTSLGGTWAALFSSATTASTSSSAKPADGSLDIRIANSGSATGAQLAAANVASLLTSPFALSLSFDVVSESGTGTGPQFQFGSSTIGNGNNWLQVNYNSAGNLALVTSNGAGSYLSVTLGSYASFSNLGDYVTLSVTIDPTSHKYTGVTLSGTKQSLDLTSTVLASNGGMIPWNGTAPSDYLSLYEGSSTTSTVDFDKFSITPVPEPGIVALVAGGLVAVSLGYRRKECR